VSLPARQRRRGWYTALAIVSCVLVVALGALFIPPGWWAPSTAIDGSRFEQEVSSELSRIRPPEKATWAMAIGERELNAWLANRLQRWIEHDEALSWPEGLQQVQLHLRGDGVVEIGTQSGGIIWRVCLKATLEEQAIAFTPVSAHAGLVPVPATGLDWLLELLPEGSLDADGFVRVPNEGALADGRRVVLGSIKPRSGTWVLNLETVSPGEVSQQRPTDTSISND